jgi:type IV pilus assembly protein PilM
LEKLKQFSEESPPQLTQTPFLKTTIENFHIALTRTIYSLAKQFKGQEIQEVLLTGECFTLPWLTNALASSNNRTLLFPVVPAGFFSSGASLTQEQIQTSALPIGAALSALPHTQNQINFRQAEFSYPDPWKRLKVPVLSYLALCLSISAALVFLGKTFAHYQEAELKKEYLDLLHSINKSYTEFEKEVARKSSPSKELTQNEIPDFTSMPPEIISKRLNYLEKDIQSTPQTFPLQPNVPLVSDVLAWISTHPNVVGIANADTPNPPSLKIENFSYTMLKRPELSKKQEKYQVKVELEFTSPTPKMAREFHDILIAPNDIVDPKGEIKWNSSKDRYRTSFYLKDRTIYTN